MNFANLLLVAACRFADRPAVSQDRTRLSYAELAAAVDGFTADLRGRGLGPGDHVAILSWNRPEVLVAFWACFAAGICVVPINPRSAAAEVEFILADSEAALIVHGPEFDEAIAEVVRSGVGPAALAIETVSLDAGGGTPSQRNAEVDPDHLAWLFYTSGTTGRPKGAMLTHANLSFMVVSWLADLGCGHEAVALHSTPLSHAAGFHSLVVTAAGGHNAIFSSTRFETGLMLEALADTRATDIHLVPTQVKMLLDDPAFGSFDLSALETIFYGAAPYALPDLREAIELLGPERMVQLYAQGETPMTATFLPRSEHIVDGEGTDVRLSSVGYPRTGMEVRVVAKDGDRLPAGEVGEVTVRGPAVMKGYWNAPEASAEALRDGWLHTGDLGRFDDRGRLHLAGRLKDVINSGGSNIYAIEVENVLLTHPDVHAATVVGVPDSKWGESVLAVLVADGSVALDPESVDRHCRSHLGSYKVPKRYEIVTELPRNAVGKVLKRELRDRFA